MMFPHHLQIISDWFGTDSDCWWIALVFFSIDFAVVVIIVVVIIAVAVAVKVAVGVKVANVSVKTFPRGSMLYFGVSFCMDAFEIEHTQTQQLAEQQTIRNCMHMCTLNVPVVAMFCGRHGHRHRLHCCHRRCHCCWCPGFRELGPWCGVPVRVLRP